MAAPADYDLPAELAVTLRPVAVMRSPHRVHHDAPRQPRRHPDDDGGPGGVIVVRRDLHQLLADLDGFSHVWVLFWCHHSRGWNAKVQPPRDGGKRGLFATRAPDRPNPLGLSVLAVRGIERRVVHVGAHDLLDGTPILDLKPYVPYCDALPNARAGWVDALRDGGDGPDHRPWFRDKGVPPPRAYGDRGA